MKTPTDKGPSSPKGQSLRHTIWSDQMPKLQVAWSASSLSEFMLCPRRYEYGVIRRMSPAGRNVHTDFGGTFHASLEVWDLARLEGDTKDKALHKALQHALDATANWQDDPDEPAKSRAALLRAVVWYVDEQPEEGGFDAIRLNDGRPAVELPFAVPLPYDFATGEQAILRGYFDGFCQEGGPEGDCFVRERKTTSTTVGGYYLASYAPNVQIDTYDLAAYLLYPELHIRGVLLEATQTAIGFTRFLRKDFKHSPSQRQEWLDQILHVLSYAEECAKKDHWPMNRASCNIYGGCPYRRVCALSPGQRDRVLHDTGQFVERPVRDIDLQEKP